MVTLRWRRASAPGPCGVLAVVQAFLIRALHLRAPSPAALLEVLVAAAGGGAAGGWLKDG